jgi:stage V sporulation protein SpoVS
MLAYSFVVRNNGAAEIEKLGAMALANDGEALAFGQQMIRDLIREGAEQYAGSTVDIAQDERAVASIPFDACPGQKK